MRDTGVAAAEKGGKMRMTVKLDLSMVALIVTVMLSACADTPGSSPTSQSMRRDTPSAPGTVGRYKVGKPYQIKGTWYHPEEDLGYEEVGMASWYGRQFHGRSTANGEKYDMTAMTAAHRTLPLPSMVRVTNLSNGRSVKLRVNDRGPFAKERIIDVSRRAAKELGFKNKGVTRVRVEILADESRTLAGRNGGRTSSRASRVGLTPDPAVAALNRKQLTAANARRSSRSVARAPVAAPVAATSRTVVMASPPAPAGTRTYIQAGSFSDQNNAHRVRSRLSGLGPVEVRPLQVGGRNFYRVRVGPLPSDDHADRVLGDVIRAGYPTSRIVSE